MGVFLACEVFELRKPCAQIALEPVFGTEQRFQHVFAWLEWHELALPIWFGLCAVVGQFGEFDVFGDDFDEDISVDGAQFSFVEINQNFVLDAQAAGIANPSIEVRLPGGATIAIGADGGKDKAAPAVGKVVKGRQRASSRRPAR